MPHALVDAFKATLEETLNADLLLHVIDVAAEHRDTLIAEVESVLAEIGASEVPQLRIYNKIDLLEQAPRLMRDERGQPQAVYLSARENQGLDLLEQALRELLQSGIFEGDIELAPAQGKLRAALFDMGAVTAEAFTDTGCSVLSIRLPEKEWQRLQHQH